MADEQTGKWEKESRSASIGDAMIVIAALFFLYGLPFLFCAGIVAGLWKWVLGL